MKTTKGDLIKLATSGEFDVIVHGCNCFHIMGAGIAKSIKTRFPEAYLADRRQSIKGDRGKLGTYTRANVLGGELTVINAYTQYSYGRGPNRESPVDYEAIGKVFALLRKELPKGSRVGIPRIGAGLAGGDWQLIQSIIEEAINGMDLTLVEYAP